MTTTIRTFRAPTASAALAAVKLALGPDAVILSTREVSSGLLRRQEVEVTAGISDDNKPPDKTPENAPPALPPPTSSEIHPLSAELASLRVAIEDVRRQMMDVADDMKSHRPLQPARSQQLLEILCERGVEESIAQELVWQSSLEESRPAGLEGLRRAVAQRLAPARPPWSPGTRKIVALVGPTGVGKTTTLAKIAAKAVMESKINIALVTVDTYRIGASEQLARYGEIMDAPTFVAKNRGEPLRAISRAAQAQLVLVDTAGRSLSEAVAKQAELIRSVPEIELHLVLSAATGARELSAAVERYTSLRPDRLIFTKLDEAACPGSILSATVKLEKPICCIADGQRVPEDLHALTGTEMADLILGIPPSADLALGEGG